MEVSSGGITASWAASTAASRVTSSSVDPALIASASEFHLFLLKLEVALRYFQALLTTPQFHVIASHLGQQTHHHIVASLGRSLPIRGGRFQRTTFAAE